MNPENASCSSDPETCYYMFLLSGSYLSTAHFRDAYIHFFASTDRIYKPLIERNRDHLDSNLFLLKRLEMFADNSGQRFCKFDIVQLHKSKKCDT